MGYLLLIIQNIQTIIAYSILDTFDKQNKTNYFILLIIGVFICAVTLLLPPTSDCFILFTLLTYLSVLMNKDKNMGFSLLIVTVASIIPLINNYLLYFLADLFALELNLFDDGILAIFLVCHVVLAVCFAFLFKKMIINPLLKAKKEEVFGYLFAAAYLLFLVYDLYIYIGEMPPDFKEEMIINMMFVFIFLLLVIGATVVASISRNKQLELDKKQKEFEYTAMEKYTDEVNKQYQDIRKFKHDYLNILSSMDSYIKEKDVSGLETYYYQNILPTKEIFEKNSLHLNDLQKIQSNPIKSLLMTKLVLAQEKEIEVQIEVRDVVPPVTTVDPILFVRILGILLDNAIEELEALQSGELRIAIFTQETDLVFIIQNTCRANVTSIQQLKQSGYSTKGAGRGVGLHTVDELIKASPHLLLETMSKDQQFTQVIRITEEDEEEC